MTFSKTSLVTFDISTARLFGPDLPCSSREENGAIVYLHFIIAFSGSATCFGNASLGP